MEKFWVAIIIIGVGALATYIVLSKTISNPSDTSQPDINAQGTSPTPTPELKFFDNNKNAQPQPTQVPKTPLNLLYAQSEWVTTATQAAIATQKGAIVITLYGKDAPKTVTNFATLAKKGYYDSLTFHRVEPGFVIQGGDPNGDGSGGRSIYGDTFEDELNPNTPSYKAGYAEGVVAMANRGPNTNGSQFFIMLADNLSLPKNYTIFGKVTSGMDVVKKIQVGDKILGITIE